VRSSRRNLRSVAMADSLRLHSRAKNPHHLSSPLCREARWIVQRSIGQQGHQNTQPIRHTAECSPMQGLRLSFWAGSVAGSACRSQGQDHDPGLLFQRELGSQGRRLSEHLAVSRHVRLDRGNSAVRWKLVSSALEQFLAFGVTRGERMPHFAAQHDASITAGVYTRSEDGARAAAELWDTTRHKGTARHEHDGLTITHYPCSM
jgi:hypothetical protein